MAENFKGFDTSASPGDTFAADEIGGVKVPRSKVVFGGAGTATDVSAATPFPVAGTVSVTGTSLTNDSVLRGSVGATTESAAGSDTATSGLNGLTKRLLQRMTDLINVLAARLPTTLGAKVSASSLSVTVASDQSAVPAMATFLDGAGNPKTVSNVDSASRMPVAVQSGIATTALQDAGNTLIGAVTEAAAGSDTASSGLNGRLQRVAQNISTVSTAIGAQSNTAAASDTATASLIALIKRVAQNVTTVAGRLPAALGSTTSSASLSVALASDHAAVPVSGPLTDTQLRAVSVSVIESTLRSSVGATTEAAAASDTATSGLNGRLQRIAQNLTALIGVLPASLGNKPASSALAVVLSAAASGSGATTPFHLKSGASTNGTSLKTSTGRIYDLVMQNLGAAVAYVKFYAKSSPPTVGTDTPQLVFLIYPGQTLVISSGFGLIMSGGIAMAITGGLPDSDTTAVAANQVIVNLTYV